MRQLDPHTFELDVPANVTFGGLFEACKFNMVHPSINEVNFPLSKLGHRRSILKIFDVPLSFAEEGMPVLLNYNRWRPTTTEEVLLFCGAIGDTKEVYPLVMTGPCWNRPALDVRAYLTPELLGPVRRLDLTFMNPGRKFWDKQWKFVAARLDG